MKTILVATDFSPAAINAGNYAADMAMSINADLLLLHIIQVPVSYAEMPVPINLDDWIRDAETKLNELKNMLGNRTGNKLVISYEVVVGTFFYELKKVCDNKKPYAVVMGSQGTTAAERFFFGSHTIYAMKHLAWPLVTVPPAVAFSGVKKIGLACDFNDVEHTIPAEEIIKAVHNFNAQLHVLHTGKNEMNTIEIFEESSSLRQMLKAVNPLYHFIPTGNTDEGILNFARENEIDLLIVLPKRHSLIEQLIHGSHSKEMLLYSDVPLMTLHE